MYREEAFKASNDVDNPILISIAETTANLNQANFEYAQISQKLEQLRVAAPSPEITTTLTELESLLTTKNSQPLLEKLIKLKRQTQSGGVLDTTVGMDGVGRLEQCIAVKLPSGRYSSASSSNIPSL